MIKWGGGGRMDKRLRRYARELRRNMTKAERRLWRRLRGGQLGVKFRRQQPIGRYIVDFVCLERRLVVEVDGGQHDGSEYDRERDEWLEREGYRVVRFWDNEVMKEIEGVMEEIARVLREMEG